MEILGIPLAIAAVTMGVMDTGLFALSFLIAVWCLIYFFMRKNLFVVALQEGLYLQILVQLALACVTPLILYFVGTLFS